MLRIGERVFLLKKKKGGEGFWCLMGWPAEGGGHPQRVESFSLSSSQRGKGRSEEQREGGVLATSNCIVSERGRKEETRAIYGPAKLRKGTKKKN